MLELKNKVEKLREKMEMMESGSVEREHYRSLIVELEKELHKGAQIKVHETPEICDSCQ